MCVMPAGMAYAAVLRTIRHVLQVVHCQRVNIRPQYNNFSIARFFAIYPAVNACFSYAPVRNAHAVQFPFNCFASFKFFQADLRVRMKLPPHIHQILFFCQNISFDCHSPPSFSEKAAPISTAHSVFLCIILRFQGLPPMRTGTHPDKYPRLFSVLPQCDKYLRFSCKPHCPWLLSSPQ